MALDLFNGCFVSACMRKNLVYSVGHAEEGVEIVYKYLTTVGLFGPITTDVPAYSHIIELDLATIQSCCSGPKRAQDKVVCSQMKEDFMSCLSSPVSTKVS